MATAQKEVPIGDDELDALMAQLEAETADVVDVPVAAAAPAVTAATDEDDLDALADELNTAGEVSTDDTVALAQAEAARKEAAMQAELAEIAAKLKAKPAPVPLITGDGDALDKLEVLDDADAELAALAAELDATPTQQDKPVELPKTPAAKPTALELAKAARAKSVPEEVAPTTPAAVPVAAKPAPEPEPEPVIHLDGEDALAAVAASLEKETGTKIAASASPAPTQRKELNFYIDMAEFREEIKVSINNMDDVMMRHAGDRAFHGAQAAHADAQHSRLKLRHKVVEAQLYDKHRKAMLAAGEKVTERMIEVAIIKDPEYVASSNRVIEAETIASIRRSCTEALRDRKDMLVQLGADRRQEGQGQLRILAETQHQDKRAMAAAAVGGLRSA